MTLLPRCCYLVSVVTVLQFLFFENANAFSATLNGASGQWSASLFQADEARATLLGLLPQSGFTCTSPQQVSLVCDACSDLERVGSSTAGSANNMVVDDGSWKLRFTSSDNPYGFLVAAASTSNGEMSTTLHFKTTFVDDTLRIVRMADEIFVFERSTGDSWVDTPTTTSTIIAEDDDAMDAPTLTAESFSDIPEECELDWDDNGEMIITCDDTFLEDSATVSD